MCINLYDKKGIQQIYLRPKKKMCVSGYPTLSIFGGPTFNFFYDLWRKHQIPEFEPNLGGDILSLIRIRNK